MYRRLEAHKSFTKEIYHSGHTCDAALVFVLSPSGCRLLAAFGAAETLSLAVTRSLLAPRLRPRPPAVRPAAGLALPSALKCELAAMAACKQDCTVYVSQVCSCATAMVSLTNTAATKAA